jgi:hypothetical protein
MHNLKATLAVCLATATIASCGGRQALFQNPPPTPGAATGDGTSTAGGGGTSEGGASGTSAAGTTGASTAGSGGTSAAGSSGTSAAGSGGTSVAGSSGTSVTGSGLPDCVKSITFEDGATHGLALGPHNHVFFDPLWVDHAPTMNYAMQTVFPRPTLSMPADFAIAPASVKPDPSSGVALDPWLAELALLPAGCQPASLFGHAVTVRLLWRLDGAIGNVPGHGVFLGSYSNGEPVAYADARATTDRTLNTLTPITLTHKFADPAEPIEGIFFRAYLLGSDSDTPTTIHVDSITWQ